MLVTPRVLHSSKNPQGLGILLIYLSYLCGKEAVKRFRNFQMNRFNELDGDFNFKIGSTFKNVKRVALPRSTTKWDSDC